MNPFALIDGPTDAKGYEYNSSLGIWLKRKPSRSTTAPAASKAAARPAAARKAKPAAAAPKLAAKLAPAIPSKTAPVGSREWAACLTKEFGEEAVSRYFGEGLTYEQALIESKKERRQKGFAGRVRISNAGFNAFARRQEPASDAVAVPNSRRRALVSSLS